MANRKSKPQMIIKLFRDRIYKMKNNIYNANPVQDQKSNRKTITQIKIHYP